MALSARNNLKGIIEDVTLGDVYSRTSPFASARTSSSR